MSKYRKIFHHVSSKDVRKKHQDDIAQLRIKEEKKIKLLDYTSSTMKMVKYDWRSDGDLSAELREAMTTANVYQKLGTHDDGEIEDQVIDASLEASFEDGPDNGLENMMFKAVTIKDGGTGTGDNGGFDIGKHLAFSHNANSDGSNYVDTSSRHALLAPIDARNTDTITITAIRGNDSNGGELPDWTGEELRLMWFNKDSRGGIGDWMDIDFEDTDTRHNSISPTIIPIVPGDAGGYDGEFPGLRDWTITIPDWCKNENQRFGLWQLSHSGRQYDHYGITKITYRARTPANAFVALDKPEASSFVRFGTSEGDPKKRKKKLEDQLKASKEYTDTVLGTDFPGGSATLSEPQGSPIGYDQLAKTHIQAGTLSQQLKKALGKETSTQKTTTTANNTLQAIKSAGKVEAIKQKTVTSLTTKEKTEIVNNIGQEKYEKIETVSKTPSFENISIKHIQQVQSEIGDIETQNLSEKKPEEIKQQVHNVAQKNPEFANAMQRVGTAGKVYVNYLIGNLPDTIDNSYLGDDYVNSVFASDKAHVLDDGSLSLGDFVIGSSSPVSYDPVTNQLVVPFNYDFDTNEEQIMKDPEKYDATKLVPAIGMTAAWIVGGKYGLDSVPIPGAGYATWLSKVLGIGGKHTPGELKISPQELQKLNPNLYTQLIGRGLIPLEKFQDPYGEENYKQNLPGWFTFSSRDEHGRIWGYNYSGGWGVLSPGPGSGDPGTAESGYGTAGFDWNTQSGGTSWTFTIGDDVPEIPPKPDEELPAGKKWELIPYDPASKAPPMWTQVDIDPVAGVDELFNQNATTKEENEIADTLESEELDETKLESIFDSDASIVSRALESARDPAYSYQNGDDTVLYGYDMGGAWRDIQYTSGPKLQWRPPEVDGVSSYKIRGLEFNILKPNERWTGDWKTKEEVSMDKWWPQQQIEEILGDKLFYDKDEDNYYRSAKNYIADLPDAKDYIADNGKLAFHDSWSYNNIWQNYLTRFQEYQGKDKESVWTTSDGKSAWGWVPSGTMNPEKYGGGPSQYTSDPEAKEIIERYWEVWNEDQRLMHENDRQYSDEIKVPKEIYRNKLNDLEPIVTKHNLEKKEIAKEEKAYKEVAKHNMIKANGVPRYESCFANCKWYTRDDGTKFQAGPPVLHRRDYIVKGRDNKEYVIYKKGDPVLFFPSGKGTGKFEGKWEKYDNRKIYDELAHNVELWKEENYGPWYEKYNNLSQYGANITLEYEQAVWDLKMQRLIRSAQNTKTIRDMMDNDPLSDSYIGNKDKDPETPPKPDEPLPPGMKWELIPARYGGIVDGQWDPDYMHSPPAWTQVYIDDPHGDTPEDSDEVTPEDEKWLDTQQTLVNLTKVLTHIGLPNDFGQWSINYAKGDMTPITQFSAGMRREVESMVLKKFKENPNSKTVSIQYSDYGWKFKNMSSRLGLGRFTATRLPNGKVRIDDTFNVDQTFKTVGAFDIIPTLQDTANRIVDIAHKRRNINTYDEGGIPVKVTLDMKSKLKRLDLSVDDPIVRDSTPKRKRKKSNYTPSKISESKKENSFDKIKKVSKSFNYPGKPTPSPDGFPDDPPPELDPKTGMHPRYGKNANRYKKLDPISANSMPKTGDPEIDAVVAKQKKEKKTRSNWREELESII